MASFSKVLPLLSASLLVMTAPLALAQTSGSEGTETAKEKADRLLSEGVVPGVQNETREEGKPGVAGGHSQAAFIAAYDADGDGKVSLDELIMVRTTRLQASDKDGDGFYNEAEYVAEYEGRQRQQYADQGKEYVETDKRVVGGLEQAGVRFNLLDRDRDGLLSLEEDLASARKTFAHNDTDGDGFVTAADPKPKREDDDSAAQDGADADKAEAKEKAAD